MACKNLLLSTLVLALVACSDGPTPPDPKPPKAADESATITPNVVYGRDNRLDLYQVQDPGLLKLAAGTAALMKNSQLSPRPGFRFEIRTTSYADQYKLCSTEPFVEQSTAAFCSGFLVGDDLMVTAGHCIRNQSDCDETSFVFNFAVSKAGVLPTHAAADDVYRCKNIVHTQIGPNGADFAVVRVDRKVSGRQALTLRQSGHANIGDQLVVIGHPAGLPTKVAGEGIVRSVENEYMVASLDTYGGNSGSAVFNSTTGEVEGVLVRGELDFKFQGSCRISNICNQSGCRGEDVTRIEFPNEFIHPAN